MTVCGRCTKMSIYLLFFAIAAIPLIQKNCLFWTMCMSMKFITSTCYTLFATACDIDHVTWAWQTGPPQHECDPVTRPHST